MGASSSSLNTLPNDVNDFLPKKRRSREASWSVPLYSKNPSEGSIEYLASRRYAYSFSGFFSFTFYIRGEVTPEYTTKQSNLYLLGLMTYIKILEHEPFTNWGILIYTDEYTLDTMKKRVEAGPNKLPERDYEERNNLEMMKQLLQNRRVIFAKVTWPSYQRNPAVPQINGPTLRPFRSRAPFDFPDKPIFIRDADTLFEGSLKYASTKLAYYTDEQFQAMKEEFFRDFLAWEAKMLELIPTLQEYLGGYPPLVLGTGKTGIWNGDPFYKRPWHSNELLGKNAPFGIFAGFVNVTPGIDMYKTVEPWDEVVELIHDRSRRLNELPSTLLEEEFRKYKYLQDPLAPTPKENFNTYKTKRLRKNLDPEYAKELQSLLYRLSNNAKLHRVGRDEQMYLFVLMPKAIHNIFIFNQSLGDMTLPKPDYEYHTRLLQMYKDAIARNFVPLPPPPPEEGAPTGWGTGGKRKTQKRRSKRSMTRKAL